MVDMVLDKGGKGKECMDGAIRAVGNWVSGAIGTIGGFDFLREGGEMFDDGFVGYGGGGEIS